MLKKWSVLLLVFLLVLNSAAGAELISVTLSDEKCESASEAVTIEGSVVKITAPGEYLLTGSLSNGQIRVDCKDDGKVVLNLQNVKIHNETGAAILIEKVRPRARISLMADTVNELSNGDNLIYEADDEPNGVIFSRSDLTIEGSGELKISAGAMDGIASKDDLKVEGGKISVIAPRHGLRGKDSVEISAGDITIQAGKDGIRSNNSKDAEKGFISITGGTIRITAGDDPLDFVTALMVKNAEITSSVAGAADED